MSKLKMSFTETERRTLILALRLAYSWESSLEDANHGDKARGHGLTVLVRACRRNMKRFDNLLLRFGAETNAARDEREASLPSIDIRDVIKPSTK